MLSRIQVVNYLPRKIIYNERMICYMKMVTAILNIECLEASEFEGILK
jgi:hypothetical protein